LAGMGAIYQSRSLSQPSPMSGRALFVWPTAIQPILDALSNGVAFSIAELPDQPVGRVVSPLTVVTTACALTERHNVPRNRTGAIRAADWYPVIGGEGVP